MNWNERIHAFMARTRINVLYFLHKRNVTPMFWKKDLFLRSDDKEFSQLRETRSSISPEFHQRSEIEIPKLRVM